MPAFAPIKSTNRLRIKTQFASAILAQTAEAIREEQQSVAQEWSLFDTLELKRSLQGHFSVKNTDTGSQLSMSYLVYARFLDIADPRRKVNREGYHLYNRIVFGILYNRTLAALKFGFTDDIRKSMTQILSEAAGDNVLGQALLAKSLRSGYF